MNDPLIWGLISCGGKPWGNRGHCGPGYPGESLPRGLSQLCSGGLGPIHPAEAFFLNEKTTGKTLEVSLHVFFVFFFVGCFGFNVTWRKTDVLEFLCFFFLGGGGLRGWGCESSCFVGWIYFDVFDDVFEFALWMFLDGSWVNCRCFQFCKKPLATWIDPSKISPPSRLMAVKESFVVLVYLCSFAGSILFGIQQLRFFQRLDEQHDTHLNKK